MARPNCTISRGCGGGGDEQAATGAILFRESRLCVLFLEGFTVYS